MSKETPSTVQLQKSILNIVSRTFINITLASLFSYSSTMHCSTLLQIAAHFAVLTIAAPAPQDTEKAAQFNPTVLSIQPDNGGSPQDDCGKGALLLNPNTWNAHGMDDRIRSFWDQGVSNPNFDFHQAFASQYSVDLSCPDSFTNCLGDPSSCSALSGDVASKEQGWLGIKSILQVQALFLQVEKAISNVFDGIAGDLVEFQDVLDSQHVPVMT